MRLRIATFGDLHLGTGLGSIFPNYSFDANDMVYKALSSALAWCKENGVKHVILLGDIFHSPDPSQADQKRLLDFFRDNNYFNFYAIAGNHDYSTTDKISLEIAKFSTEISDQLSHVKFFITPELVHIKKIPFSFLPWPHHKTLHSPSVNIAHIEIPGSLADNGKKLENGYQISKSGVWYIGHLHRKQEYRRAFYPGMMYQRTFGEPESPKGFYCVDVKYDGENLQYSHEFVETQPPYKLVTSKISHADELKKIKKPDPHNIVQYRLLMKNGVEIPPGFLEEYSNVIDVAGRLSVKEMESLEKYGFDVGEMNTDFDLLDGLDEYLENDGLSVKEVRKAKTYLTGLIEEMRL